MNESSKLAFETFYRREIRRQNMPDVIDEIVDGLGVIVAKQVGAVFASAQGRGYAKKT